MLIRILLCFLVSIFVGQTVLAQDRSYKPDIKSRSNEGQLAMEGFAIPDDLEVKLWASEPDLANPVAFCIDEKGRIYVCETFRQQKGVEDNRGHMNWLADDLSLTSVEERLEMFKKFLGDDVQKYAVEQDRIRLLEDTDGDGQADKASIFADGFNDIVDGTGAGILAIDGNVYYTCIPKLYQMRDDDEDGRADEVTTLHDGFGVRVAFRGHDMHGLIMGPDGRLYFSIGDRGYNVTTPEGKHLFRPDTGAVFRCELDGSNLEEFAYGLRNPQELAFDNYGNLFTGDNNSDSGDQARWVYVTEGSDTGWRMYFQYLPDRGPWNRERMWYPYRADEETSAVQPASIVPPIINISDGPSGLVHYPGVGLSPEYDDHFFLVDFRGSASQSGIRHFHLQPKGATFELVDDGWFVKSALITDVDFGYDGRMYMTDWVDGWEGSGKGRIYSLSSEKYRLPSIQEAPATLMKEGFASLQNEKLVELLGHPDQRIRQRAQFQLVKNEAASGLEQSAATNDSLFARLHAIWGLGQLLRVEKTSPDHLLSLTDDVEPEVRAQVLNVLGDARSHQAASAMMKAVEHGTPREQYFAAIGLGKLREPVARPAIVELLKKNDNADPGLRHAGIMGLVGTSTENDLVKFTDPSFPPSVRLAAVVALRKQGSRLVSSFLNDADENVVVEAARAIHDLDMQEALTALSKVNVTPDSPDALLRRVLSANYRAGQPANAEVIARVAASDRYDEAVRLEAMEELLNWDKPPVFDRVTNKHHPLAERSLDSASDAVRKHLAGMMTGDAKLKTRAIRLATKYQVKDVAKYLAETFNEMENSGDLRAAALTALDAVNAPGLENLLDKAASDQSDLVRAEARDLLAARNPAVAVPKLAEAMQSGSVIERQAAVRTLAKLKRDDADQVLLKALDDYVAGNLSPEIQLDLIEVAQSRVSDEFQNRLASIDQTRDPGDPLAAFRECLQGGNFDRGVEIFFGNAAASCRRCHKVQGNGSDVGPDLSAVSKENPREYLLESIVTPNAKIAKGFETVVFAMDDGRVVSGIIKGETDTTYRLMKPMGEIVVVEKANIEEQAKGQSGMPADMAKQLSKSDIRDLVEYLSTLKTPYQADAHR